MMLRYQLLAIGTKPGFRIHSFALGSLFLVTWLQFLYSWFLAPSHSESLCYPWARAES